MKTIDKCCGQCRYWDHLSFKELKKCNAPLPASVSGWRVRLGYTAAEYGTSCPAYRKRINRRKSAKVIDIRNGGMTP